MAALNINQLTADANVTVVARADRIKGDYCDIYGGAATTLKFSRRSGKIWRIR